MHICFLTHEYPKSGYPHGGVGTFIKTIGRELVKAGIDVSVVGINYTTETETEIDNGVRIYRLSSAKVKGITWCLYSGRINKTLREIHRNHPIDIIESTELGLAFIKKIKGVKYLIRLHGGHYFFAESENRGINWWKGFQERISFRKADKIIGVSKYVLKNTAKYLEFYSKEGPVIYNFIDLRKFYESNPGNLVKNRILFAGTVCEKKGIRQLVMSMPLIRKEVQGARLVIAGRDWKSSDGISYTDRLKEQIPEGETENITFLGPVAYDKMPRLIESAEICVFPSHMETFGIVAIEAMCMSKPVVFTKAGPGPEIVTDGVTGLLCDPLNPEDIAMKILHILKNPEIGFSLGKAARKSVTERFSEEKLVRQNISFYQSLLKK